MEKEETIYQKLRQDILLLKLKPGVILSIKDITDQYGYGRSPVRDAIISLSKEYLITILPQRGTMISKIDYEKANNEQFLRQCVEENVMLEFMATANVTAINEMELSLLRQKEIQKINDIRLFIAEDNEFHAIGYKYTKRSYCNQVLAGLSGDYLRMRLMLMTHCDGMKRIIEQHEQLLSTIKVRDAKNMKKVLAEHLTIRAKEVNDIVKIYPDVFNMEKQEIIPEEDDKTNDFLYETKLKFFS